MPYDKFCRFNIGCRWFRRIFRWVSRSRYGIIIATLPDTLQPDGSKYPPIFTSGYIKQSVAFILYRGQEIYAPNGDYIIYIHFEGINMFTWFLFSIYRQLCGVLSIVTSPINVWDILEQKLLFLPFKLFKLAYLYTTLRQTGGSK